MARTWWTLVAVCTAAVGRYGCVKTTRGREMTVTPPERVLSSTS